jgi:alkanesulfonate monooxygenase SsuD/methylene tetrahydromethanopterin reductase-like flavin-dependent oxidoreductase (luciferase family)
MHLGIALPFGDIGGDGPIVREFAQLAEAEGYRGLTLADHVLGGNPANPASGRAGGSACSTTLSWPSVSSLPAQRRSNSPPRC